MAYWSRIGVKPRRCRFDSCWVGLIFTSMKLSQRQVRRLIEAEVDKMRKPKGPNSRDDGDKDLTEEDIVEGRLTEEVDPVYDTINAWSNSLSIFLGDVDDDLMQNDGKATTKTYEALDAISDLMMEMNRYSKMKPRD